MDFMRKTSVKGLVHQKEVVVDLEGVHRVIPHHSDQGATRNNVGYVVRIKNVRDIHQLMVQCFSPIVTELVLAISPIPRRNVLIGDHSLIGPADWSRWIGPR